MEAVVRKVLLQKLDDSEHTLVDDAIRLANNQINTHYLPGQPIEIRVRRYGYARIDAETLRRLKGEGGWEVEEIGHDSRYFTLRLS